MIQRGPYRLADMPEWQWNELVTEHNRCEHSFSQVGDRDYRCWKCGADEPEDEL